MKWTKTNTTAAVGGAILMSVLTLAVAQQLESATNDGDFRPDADHLRQLPSNISVVRPTHFAQSYGKIRHLHTADDSLARTVGRNVTFCELMAEAYDSTPGRVVLPADAPGGGFDFLVTISPHPRRYLRAAVEQETGYSASEETRSTEVLTLQVAEPGLPGLTNSPDSEDDDVTFKDGRLYFQHQTLDVIFKGLEEGLRRPLVDQTGLTNAYDFSVGWSQEIAQKMRSGEFDLGAVNKAIGKLGLVLKPEMTNVDMVIVERNGVNK